MSVLFRVLHAVLALSGLKLTEGECFTPHTLLGKINATMRFLVEDYPNK